MHCLINTATALLELLTDYSIRVSRSFIAKDGGWGGEGDTCPLCPPPPGSAPEVSEILILVLYLSLPSSNGIIILHPSSVLNSPSVEILLISWW